MHWTFPLDIHAYTPISAHHPLKEREPNSRGHRHLDADPLGLVDRSGLIRFTQ